jgi:hypothetical protein
MYIARIAGDRTKDHFGELGSDCACKAQAPSLWQRGASKFRTDVQPLDTRIITHPGQALYETVVHGATFLGSDIGECLRCDLVALSQVRKIETVLTPARK